MHTRLRSFAPPILFAGSAWVRQGTPLSSEPVDIAQVPAAAQTLGALQREAATEAYMAMIPRGYRPLNAITSKADTGSFSGTASIPRRFALLLLNLRWSARMRGLAEPTLTFKPVQTLSVLDSIPSADLRARFPARVLPRILRANINTVWPPRLSVHGWAMRARRF